MACDRSLRRERSVVRVVLMCVIGTVRAGVMQELVPWISNVIFSLRDHRHRWNCRK